MCGIALSGRVDLSNVAIPETGGHATGAPDGVEEPWRYSTQGDLAAVERLSQAHAAGLVSDDDYAAQRSLLYPKVDDRMDVVEWFFAMNDAGFILDSEFDEVQEVLERSVIDPDFLAEFAWVWSGRFRLAVEGEISFEQYFEEQNIMLGRHLVEGEAAAPPVHSASEETDKVARLKDLAELLREGLISQDDFDLLKAEILNG
jgi:hypothetical protein